jgi:hypothetical protein
VERFEPGPSLFVFAYEKATDGDVLAGFFPLVVQTRYRGLPVRLLTLWQHPYCFLGAPLLRRGSEQQCLGAFLDWANRSLRCSLVELPSYPGQGPLHQAVIDECHQHGRRSLVHESRARACFVPRPDDYRTQSRTTRSLKEHRRRERRLRELGRLEYRILQRSEEVERWSDDFLRLEGAGWKGESGTAFTCQQADRAFFQTIISAAWARGRLLMQGMFLDDRPIALKCNLLAGTGSFAFKIAYDETLAKYSPGVQLELFNIDYLHGHPEVRWMDSCAVPGHSMIDKLWLDRRAIEDVVLSTGRIQGDLFVSLVPALRWLKRQVGFHRSRAPATAHGETAHGAEVSS